MEVKSFMGIANILAIFGDLNPEDKRHVIKELYAQMRENTISTKDCIPWIDATYNKPPIDTKVLAKGGFRQEMYSMLLVWDGKKWYDSIKYDDVGTVSHFFIP